MIICRTPLRISFFGGGTDFPEFYNSEEGAVLSACIDKYITIKAREEDVQRESGLYFLNWQIFSEIGGGTGLGRSGALAVSYMHLLCKGQTNEFRLAESAYTFEANIIKNATGRQDHLAVSLGGLNKLTFTPSRINNYRYGCHRLFKNLLLFRLPGRKNGESIRLHIENIEKNRNILRKMKNQVNEAIKFLESEDYNSFGLLLHEGWELKKQISKSISNDDIDILYGKALRVGAIGGKVCGSGGGGHLLIMVGDPGKKEAVRRELRDLKEIPVRFERQGSMVYCDGSQT